MPKGSCKVSNIFFFFFYVVSASKDLSTLSLSKTSWFKGLFWVEDHLGDSLGDAGAELLADSDDWLADDWADVGLETVSSSRKLIPFSLICSSANTSSATVLQSKTKNQYVTINHKLLAYLSPNVRSRITCEFCRAITLGQGSVSAIPGNSTIYFGRCNQKLQKLKRKKNTYKLNYCTVFYTMDKKWSYFDENKKHSIMYRQQRYRFRYWQSYNLRFKLIWMWFCVITVFYFNYCTC